MIKGISSKPDKLTIEDSDGKVFELAAKDFPIPTNEGDRVEVEALIEGQIKQVFPDDTVKIHIYRLDPLVYTVGGGNLSEDWWVR